MQFTTKNRPQIDLDIVMLIN